MIAAIVSYIAAAVMTEKMTPMKLPAGVAMSTAKMLPVTLVREVRNRRSR